MGRGGGGGALFDFLLGAQVVGVAALPGAVDSTGVQVGVTFGADHLVAVVLLGALAEGGLHDGCLPTEECGHHALLIGRDVLPALDLTLTFSEVTLGLTFRGMVLPISLHSDLLLCTCWGGCSAASPSQMRKGIC